MCGLDRVTCELLMTLIDEFLHIFDKYQSRLERKIKRILVRQSQNIYHPIIINIPFVFVFVFFFCIFKIEPLEIANCHYVNFISYYPIKSIELLKEKLYGFSFNILGQWKQARCCHRRMQTAFLASSLVGRPIYRQI